MNDGPFTDDMIRNWVQVAKTQRSIIDYAEGMAQVLAEAGRASHKAIGDDPAYAVNKWVEIIRRRAMEILKEDKCEVQNPSKKPRKGTLLC